MAQLPRCLSHSLDHQDVLFQGFGILVVAQSAGQHLFKQKDVLRDRSERSVSPKARERSSHMISPLKDVSANISAELVNWVQKFRCPNRCRTMFLDDQAYLELSSRRETPCKTSCGNLRKRKVYLSGSRSIAEQPIHVLQSLS